MTFAIQLEKLAHWRQVTHVARMLQRQQHEDLMKLLVSQATSGPGSHWGRRIHGTHRVYPGDPQVVAVERIDLGRRFCLCAMQCPILCQAG